MRTASTVDLIADWLAFESLPALLAFGQTCRSCWQAAEPRLYSTQVWIVSTAVVTTAQQSTSVLNRPELVHHCRTLKIVIEFGGGAQQQPLSLLDSDIDIFLLYTDCKLLTTLSIVERYNAGCTGELARRSRMLSQLPRVTSLMWRAQIEELAWNPPRRVDMPDELTAVLHALPALRRLAVEHFVPRRIISTVTQAVGLRHALSRLQVWRCGQWRDCSWLADLPSQITHLDLVDQHPVGRMLSYLPKHLEILSVNKENDEVWLIVAPKLHSPGFLPKLRYMPVPHCADYGSSQKEICQYPLWPDGDMTWRARAQDALQEVIARHGRMYDGLPLAAWDDLCQMLHPSVASHDS